MADTLTDTMDALVSCVCEALETINRPTCECGLTIGQPARGPSGCCECETGAGGGVSGFLERVYPADPTTLEQTVRYENCKPGAKAADITVAVIRCYPAMDEQGNMPTLDATTPYAHNLNDDLTAAWNALACCGTKIVMREAIIQGDPEGGCSGFAIQVTTLVSLPVTTVDPS